MTPEDFNYFQSRVTRFISGSSSGMKFGTPLTPKYTRLSRIVPKRILPQQILERIQKKTISDDGGELETDTKGITSLGKVTLNLEYTKNNLEKILQIISEDYKNSQKQNKKELDEYRKRIANRGRIFGRKELGDNKSDVLGTVKKYVGSFFSGAGGSIRALALFNLLQGILSGDPSKIIGPLLGIGMTYIPSIIGSVIGGVIGGVGKSLVGKLLGGGAKAAAPAAAGAAAGGVGAGLKGAAKFGGKAALLGGGLALASGMINRPQEDDQQKQRLEELTQQQKASVDSQSLVPIPQNELKRFDNLNKKFEEALDFLLKKQKEGSAPRSQPSAGGGGGTILQGSPSAGDFTGSDGSQKTMNYLMSQGLTKEQSAGIAGNLMQESTFNPRADNTGTGETDTRGHFGIAQWDKVHRWPRVKSYIESVGMDPYSLEGQLVGLKWEAEKRGDWRRIKNELTPDAAARSWLENFERSLEGPGSVGYENRIKNARSLAMEIQTISRKQPVASTSAVLASAEPTSAAPRTSTRRNVPAVSPTPRVTVVPVPVSTQPQQQTSAASPSSSIVPPIDTTYPENFLALYSKLTYQIV